MLIFRWLYFGNLGERVVAFEPVDLDLGPAPSQTTPVAPGNLLYYLGPCFLHMLSAGCFLEPSVSVLGS